MNDDIVQDVTLLQLGQRLTATHALPCAFMAAINKNKAFANKKIMKKSISGERFEPNISLSIARQVNEACAHDPRFPMEKFDLSCLNELTNLITMVLRAT